MSSKSNRHYSRAMFSGLLLLFMLLISFAVFNACRARHASKYGPPPTSYKTLPTHDKTDRI